MIGLWNEKQSILDVFQTHGSSERWERKENQKEIRPLKQQEFCCMMTQAIMVCFKDEGKESHQKNKALGFTKMVRLIHNRGVSHPRLADSAQSLLAKYGTSITLTIMMMIKKMKGILHEPLEKNTATQSIQILVYLDHIQSFMCGVIQRTNTCIGGRQQLQVIS